MGITGSGAAGFRIVRIFGLQEREHTNYLGAEYLIIIYCSKTVTYYYHKPEYPIIGSFGPLGIT